MKNEASKHEEIVVRRLQIKREYLQDIESGHKRLEYREKKPFYDRLFTGVIGRKLVIRFVNGYTAKAKTLDVVVRDIRLVQCLDEKERRLYYEIELGEQINIKAR